MLKPKPTLQVVFYAESNGNEPVRKWLKSLDEETRFIIGTDVKKVQFRWPLGLPLVRNLGGKLWEIRSSIPNGIARIIFIISTNKMVLLHGFIKKTQKIPSQDFKLAKERIKNYEKKDS
ncbi:Uncharacterized protein DB41_JD00020 [Neochlamydia sp. TUME1]|jgi:phage-related protein|uniref:type II toxin-antitoxin system RelE/ParE family toxin n=1 Tax=Neochlamydia sp. TUME1 TaxID=1478174 RepID=UPI0005805AF7|nr:type II toxin-antitoxin system RelE/ParE family toxin [Neochlamydia sp. TUME1]KIC73611.1 Uncharacterized protein DB41_JD00020 [Neochlamydia sp. TUME1]